MICLDLDNGPSGFEERLKDFPYQYCAYTTHSHTPEEPRWRLMIPLDAPVTDPDAYTAAARKIADYWFDIEWFDDTTYQPARMMYYPSCPKDGEYRLLEGRSDAPFISADDVLELYETDWHDAIAWPTSSREERAHSTTSGKAKDPLSKSGLIGTFCRAYTVQEAIDEFLPDVYVPTDSANRYTYAEGSAFGGLVVYNVIKLRFLRPHQR
ncbi:hypothetical protein [Allobaculum sp. Allo2]|nr:hypothetical protein [Allobaculum sp. Allo2]UNT92214.1 hypothetical protein KWG61_08245 [Allobaculum sp. Allo2]